MDLEWQSIQEELKQGLSRGQYDLWVATLDCLKIDGEVLIVGCKNWLHVEWLRDKLEQKMLDAVRRYQPGINKIHYEIMSAELELESIIEEERPRERHRPRQITFMDLIPSQGPRFNPRFTFDQFVVGRCNQFAYATSMAIAAKSHFYNQGVYLLADPGLGKSHLAHAVGNHLAGKQPDVKVKYVTAEQFTNEMISSLKTDCMENFKRRYREDCDVLLLERIEFFSGKRKIQSELIYTMDELFDRGKKIVCTGNSSPKDIPKLNDELRSRLNGVLVVPIDHPDFDTRVAIVKQKACRDGVEMPTEVAEFLAERASGDVRQLESCLVGVIAKSNILQMPISIGLAREVTQTMMEYLPKLNVDHILQAICSGFNTSVDELRSPTRKKALSLARRVGMYLCRQYTSESLASIGKAFGRSHSTVVYALKKMDEELSSKDSHVKRQVKHLSQKLETHCLH